MKRAHLFRVAKTNNEVLKLEYDEMPAFYDSFHFHPELQLTAIVASSGTLLVESDMISFEPGDVLLVGPDLPHVFISSNESNRNRQSLSKAISAYFNPMDLGQTFWDAVGMKQLPGVMPGNSKCAKLLGSTRDYAYKKMHQLWETEPDKRLLEYLLLLQQIVLSDDLEVVCETDTLLKSAESNSRINHVISFIASNYQRNLTLSEVADFANLTGTSFCRFFKSRTRKSFSRHLCELRVNHACKLLISSDHDISHIATTSGFNNLSNFNRKFKQIKGLTPSTYKKHASDIRKHSHLP